MWECSASTACQCHPGYGGISPLMAHDSKKLFTESGSLWADIVRAYSALSLSFEQDKLPALSGVAKYILKQRPGDEYLVGMWRKTLLVDLRWKACGPQSDPLAGEVLHGPGHRLMARSTYHRPKKWLKFVISVQWARLLSL